MSKEIEIAVKREETCIENLCKNIRQHPKVDGLESLDDKTLRDLCDRIRYAAMVDADAIRRDANFAVNKLSEALERTTRMMEQMAKPIKLAPPSAIKIDLPPIPTPFGKEG